MSVQPTHRTVVNPAINQANALLSLGTDMRSLAQKINAKARSMFGTSVLTPDQRRQLMEELRAEKLQFISAASTVAHHQDAPTQVAPRPPPRRSLYGRIADGEKIVDVGAGDCAKIKDQQGRLRITAIDPNVANLETGISHAREVEVEDLTQTVVSFNSIVQMPEPVRARMTEVDGLHVYPDHDFLKIYGCAVEQDDGAVAVNVYTHNGPLVYVDSKIDLPSLEVSPGYRLAATFERESYSLPLKLPKGPKGAYTPKSSCGPGAGNVVSWSQASWKWDGVFYEFEAYDDQAYLTGRDGCSSSVPFKMKRLCLHLEYIEKAKCFVLLRIIMYNGFIPPHCLETLNYFVQRVRIILDGKPVLGPGTLSQPPVLRGALCPVDGIILRENETDYYIKPEWTVDLNPAGVMTIQRRSAEMGFRLLVSGGVQEGLWEYSVVRAGDDLTLTPMRPRPDKLTGTTAATFEKVLSLPTLSEIVSLFGGDIVTEMVALYAL